MKKVNPSLRTSPLLLTMHFSWRLNFGFLPFDRRRKEGSLSLMKLYSYEVSQKVPASIQDLWDFFSNPNNLSKITPPSLGFESHHLGKETVHPGMIITHRVSPFPKIRIQWVTEISHVQAPFLFVDEQRFGPYKFWHHQHHFSEIPGGTLMVDRVHYALPMGFLGDLTHPFLVKPKLDSIFSHRKSAVEEICKGRSNSEAGGGRKP
jgi:ligand-binding SRPBCC domain-containing protein